MMSILTPRDSCIPSSAEHIALQTAYRELDHIYEQLDNEKTPSLMGTAPISQLYERGVTNDVLLWLLYQGHIQHYLCKPLQGWSNGSMSAASLVFEQTSRFFLTDTGVTFTRALRRHDSANGCAVHYLSEHFVLGRFTPRYDAANRLFTWGVHLLKRFRSPSANQEACLIAAERLGWPEWMNDPLPRVTGTNPKARLHDTVKDLNRRQREYLVHMKCDGTGRRWGWELH
jgi:hypothetical protein